MIGIPSLDPPRFAVATPDGDLSVARWGAGEHVVVAAHGITANHLGWALLSEELPDDVTLLAPDLRGRGDSAHVAGPWGIATHAGDLIRILDHVDAERAVLVGHSMGGFVVVTAAVRHPDRVAAAVLVDGGIAFPIEVPADRDIDEILRGVIGPAAERLRARFDSPDAYREHWRPHPAFAETGTWSEYVEAYVDHDLVERDGAYASGVSLDAVREDAASTLIDDEVTGASERLTVPTTFVRTTRGVMNQTPPLYPDAAVGPVLERLAVVDAHVIDANHYTILLDRRPARQVADLVATAVHRHLG